ncbi:MAG: DUF4124 domain-containing protein [Candidatus Binatia bacterium]
MYGKAVIFILKALVSFFCLFLWLSPVFSAGQVYQWTDSRGVIHFTDDYQAVPEPLKGSPRLVVREGFQIEGESSKTSTLSQTPGQRPIPEPKAREVIRAPEPQAVKAVPAIIDHSQHFTTIVVVNSNVLRLKKKPCLTAEGCRPVFRPNFADRRYIHPSVFSGGSRQYIRPESFQ